MVRRQCTHTHTYLFVQFLHTDQVQRLDTRGMRRKYATCYVNRKMCLHYMYQCHLTQVSHSALELMSSLCTQRTSMYHVKHTCCGQVEFSLPFAKLLQPFSIKPLGHKATPYCNPTPWPTLSPHPTLWRLGTFVQSTHNKQQLDTLIHGM